jgi:MFS transporter, FHS family, Na+ dependent glucose transporter 1
MALSASPRDRTAPRTPATLRRQITVAYFALFIALGMTGATTGPTVPGLAAQTASSIAAISNLISLRAIGRLIGTFQAGRVYDRMPGHPVLMAGMVTLALGAGLTSFMPSLPPLLILFFIMGFMEGFVDVGVNTLLVWTHRDRAGPFINGLHFFYGVGAFIVPLIIAQIVLVTNPDPVPVLAPFARLELTTPGMDVRWAYRFLLLVFIPAILLLFRLPSPAAHDEAHPVEADDKPLVWRHVLLFAGLLLLYVGAEASFSAWIFTYALARDLTDATGAAYLVSVFWAMITVGRLLAVWLSTRLKPRVILRTAILGGLGSVGLLAAFPNSLVLWVGTVLIGLFFAPIFPTALAFAGRHMTVSGRLTSYFYIGASIGVVTVPWIVGQLFTTVGPQILLICMAVALVAEFVVFLLLVRAVVE